MFGKVSRVFLLAGATLALAACGPSRDEENASQLAKARAAEQAAAEKAAQEAAARRAREANDAALASFYGGGSEDDGYAADDNRPADNADRPADDRPGSGPPPPIVEGVPAAY
ncbi:hypothetical protein [Novosphingobium mangrovi (ex Huang et al. 2023)]|uniref:Lipoprotein n=1 Tax=Novosphingobium mangrovi (ex Huang et al. 2023) TaxID=2976432 RepID=A0ABT2I6H0_9SPHN|nr:hypothetical protein [Novosphingobium mangrovi (ex Huang et al. 2023)]MCT2400409.1 hypothetical protein [Novosphingobium mangrovi (ex Huang et al. 2023)]